MSVACTHHCRRCERHFHSLEAFDAHRRRETPNGPGIGCLAPDADEEIVGQFIGFSGFCDISGPVEVVGTVWELHTRRNRVRTSKRAA